MKNHIRHELRTREKYKLVGNGVELDDRNDTRNLCVAFCGAIATGDWFFHSVDHAVLAGGAPSGTCLDCVDEIVEALKP